MNVTCIICSDQINLTRDIYSTQCGHIFHYSCLIQWIERSKSCPQCRNRATEKSIHRIFFNTPNTDYIVDDVFTLQNKLDNANLEIQQKDKKFHAEHDKYIAAIEQNNEIQKQIENLEHKLNTDEIVINSLKGQISYLKSKVKENQKLHDENHVLKNDIKQFELIQTAINGSRERLNELLREDNSQESLKLLIVTIKKALVDSEDKKNRSIQKMRQMQNELNNAKREITTLKSENSDLQVTFKKNKSLWDLEKSEMRKTIEEITSKESDPNGKIKRILVESPIPLPLKRLQKTSEVIDLTSPRLSKSVDLDQTDSPTIDQRTKQILESDSPYLPVQSTAYDYFLKNTTATKEKVALKSSRMTMLKSNSCRDMDACYDGFGGHSKFEKFPDGGGQKAALKRRIAPATATISSAKFRKLAPK